MSGFDTAISQYVIWGWAGLVLVALAWDAVRFRDILNPSYRVLLAVLRATAAVLVLILLLQPYLTVTAPDTESFRVALLADCSHSMTTRDCAGEASRLNVVGQALALERDTSLYRRLARSYRLNVFRFSEELHRLRETEGTEETVKPGTHPPQESTETEIGALPGRTALGDVLKDCLDGFSSVPLGAVLVLSDGRSNHGTAAAEVGKIYRRRGVPVSCVGIGQRRVQGDVEVEFVDDNLSGTKGESRIIKVQVRSTLAEGVRTQVELSAETVVMSRTVELAAETGKATVEFTFTPLRAGFHTLTARVPSVPGDSRPDTDIDYAGMEVDEPDVFQLLYLGAHLNWEYKFIKLLCDTNDQLSLAAVIRTGRNSYYAHGLPGGEERTGFPEEQSSYNRFDAVLFDTRAAGLLSEQAVRCLQNFVEHRGGGLLCFGPLSGLAEPFVSLLPVIPVEPSVLTAGARLDVNPKFVFSLDPGGVLRAARGLTVARAEPVSFARELKKGARAAATLEGAELTALAAQRYGSGRVAFIGWENSWRWRLQNKAGKSRHDAFWNALLVWLGSTRKQRAAAGCAGQKAGLGEEVALDVNILGTDFRPAMDARVACAIVAPSGKTRKTMLDPELGYEGRYSAVFFPEEPGEYRVRYHVRLPEEEFDHQVSFLARHVGAEMANTDYKEDALRDLARITGGRFWHYPDISAAQRLPLSDRIPLKAERHYWSRSWILLLLIAAVLGLDWFCRRRIGLK